MKRAFTCLIAVALLLLLACSASRKSHVRIRKGIGACQCARNFSLLDRAILNSCGDSAAVSKWISQLSQNDNVKTFASGDSIEVSLGDSMGAVYTFCKSVKTGYYTKGKRDGRWFVFDASGNLTAIILYLDGAVNMYGVCKNGKFEMRFAAVPWPD